MNGSTARERETLELKAHGSNGAIAEEMVITLEEVPNLINRTLAKLNLPADDPSACRRAVAVLTYLQV